MTEDALRRVFGRRPKYYSSVPTADSALPPLPKPDPIRSREELGGIALVLSVVTGLAVCTHAAALIARREPALLWAALHALIGVEAVVAVGCLAGLMLSDPGVVERSEQTCLPLPDAVAARLRADASLRGLQNVTDGASTYCVRCLVWRRPAADVHDVWAELGLTNERPTSHHCSICQRCVVDFDHHCSIFGRCITGSFLRGTGNMRYFCFLIAMAWAASLTATAALMAALFLRWGRVAAIWTVGVIAAGGALLPTVCPGVPSSTPPDDRQIEIVPG